MYGSLAVANLSPFDGVAGSMPVAHVSGNAAGTKQAICRRPGRVYCHVCAGQSPDTVPPSVLESPMAPMLASDIPFRSRCLSLILFDIPGEQNHRKLQGDVRDALLC